MGGKTLRVNFYGSEGEKRKKNYFAYWVIFFFLFSLLPSQDKMQTIISNEIRKGVIVPGRGRERLWGDPCQWCSVTTERALNSPRKALCGTDSFGLIWLDFVFSLGDKFFHFLAPKHVPTVHFKAVLSQAEHSVPYCMSVEWNAVLCLLFSPCWGALWGILPGSGSTSSEMLMIPIKALFAGPTLSPGNSGSQIIEMPPLKIRGSIWEGLQWGQQHDLLSLCSPWVLWLPALLVSDAGAFHLVSRLHWHPYITAHQQTGSTISFPV